MAALSRRSFVCGLAAVLPFPAALFAAETKPVMRLGVMSDTHVGKTVESCERVRLALELFKAKGCGMVINAGDIADHHYPAGYAAYRQVFDGVFAGGSKPREIYVYAWHDAYDYQGHPREAVEDDALAAFEDVRRLLKAENGHTDIVTFNGYTFLVFPQFVSGKGFLGWDDYRKAVAKACAASHGKPVFVVDHVPIGGVWGALRDSQRAKILSKFPQVVYLCGHSHGSLRDDLHICQTDFTAINAGCLQNWGSGTVGNPEPRRQAYGVLTIDVFADRLLVRRWDVRDGSEIHPENPWIVPLPFATSSAPWRREARKAAERVPAFASGAALAAIAGPEGFRLAFPSAGESAFKYRIDVERKGKDGAWASYTWREALGTWWLPPKERPDRIEHLFEMPFFTTGETVRFAVTPQNQYGVKGRTVIRSKALVVPKCGETRKIVLESSDPLKEFGIVSRTKASRRQKVGADGWCGPFGSGQWVLKLPDGLFAGPCGTHYRVTLDMETDQPESSKRWNLRLSNAKGPGFGTVRHATPVGRSGSMRYVMELSCLPEGKRGSSDSYDVYFENGFKSRLRLSYLKVEKLAD